MVLRMLIPHQSERSPPMRYQCTDFSFEWSDQRVAVIGLREKDLNHLQPVTSAAGIEIVNGGCIDDGSNAVQRALKAAERADVILVNQRFSRDLPPKFGAGKRVVQYHSLSQLKQLFQRPRKPRRAA